jgi:CubicO group peptidase (beta-lactamase class C family)
MIPMRLGHKEQRRIPGQQPTERLRQNESGRRRTGLLMPAAFVVFMIMTLAVAAGQGQTDGSGRQKEQVPTKAQIAGLPDRLQALLDSLVDGEEIIRNGVLLVEGPGFKWKGASGIAQADSLLPMLPDDQFNIDSIAKMMTATIVMKLVEADELGLDDRIGQYLPDSLMDGLHVYQGRSYSEQITVRHLLSHTSGFHDDWACPGFLDLVMEDPQRRWTPEETIEFVKEHCEPRFPPGEGFHYSDTGYNLLGLIIERITGRALHEVYRELLLDPLGMDHTYRPSHEEARPTLPGRLPSQRYLNDIECTSWPAVMTADWAGGGLLSTLEDLNRFLRAFVQNEIFDEPTMRDRMFRWVESGPFHNYGFGTSRVLFDRSENPEHAGLGELWGHAGSSYNFMFYWPAEDVMIIGTLNQLNVERNRYDILASIMHAVLGTQ